MLGQIYLSGFQVIKLVFTGASARMYSVKTSLTDESLRIILADSITLTPGSLFIDMIDDEITVMWLHQNGKLCNLDKEVKEITEKLEKLLRAMSM